jgi:hypothetical protein
MSSFVKRVPYRKNRTGSFSSDEGSPSATTAAALDAPILVYHESARSIVFRDHLRRAVQKRGGGGDTSGNDDSFSEDFLAPLPHKPMVVVSAASDTMVASQFDQQEALNTIDSGTLDILETVPPSEAGIPLSKIGGYTPRVTPLDSLGFGTDDVFEPLLSRDADTSCLSDAEAEVVEMFKRQKCCVKTIKNVDWGPFLHRLCFAEPRRGRAPSEQDDIGPDKAPGEYVFNSFVTSTTLLPENGLKMRCFGSTSQYTVGVVFGLPDDSDSQETLDEAAVRTKTWSWPSGFAAKTEFNIDGRGRLINGRKEALVPFSVLRQYNTDYLTKDSYMVGFRVVEGLSQIPYNEIYLRVGGLGRLVRGVDCSTGSMSGKRSLDRGVGLPVALFVRSATYGNLITLLRTRARLMHAFDDGHIKGIPLLLITPEDGVRVLTESLQKDLWKIAAKNLNPFQNSTIAHKTTISNTDEASFQQKVDELLELDESIQEMLTPEELARVAGGFGATDDSVATILRQAMMQDRRLKHESHKLQDVVNEGLASALRSGDYHTSRQLLILYSLVASGAQDLDDDEDNKVSGDDDGQGKRPAMTKRQSSLGRDTELMKRDLEIVKRSSSCDSLSTGLPRPPPPPPLDTDRLRSATNSDGLLAVLGAAQVLRAMQDGGAKKRVEEVIDAVEEWVNYGEQSVAFRISSWYDQRAAQGDLKIATETNSSFMAFVSNKAVANRKMFACQLREAAASTDFTDIRFLDALSEMLKKMHSPCLRLELLQYVLGLDNRYSVAHVARSVELAATCRDISLSGR